MAGAALGGFTLLAAVVCWALSRRRARDPHWLAQKIELAHPQLQARLLAAVEQRPEGPSGEYGYLQETVIREALEDARRHGWEETVPTRRLRTAMLAEFAALASAPSPGPVSFGGSKPRRSSPACSTRRERPRVKTSLMR